MRGWPTQIGYVPALAVVCCLAFAVALAAVRLPVAARRARAAAGGGLLAILAADLLPDALTDAREEGVSRWAVVLLVAGTFGLVRVWRAAHRHRRADTTPALMSVHGLVEGVVAGAGAGLNVMLGLPALVGMAIHKSVEGVDLAFYLRPAESGPGDAVPLSDRSGRRIGWLTLNAAAPLAGVAAGHTLLLPQLPVAVPMSVLCGLLLHVVFQISQSQLDPPGGHERWLGLAGAFVATLFLAELAAGLST